MNRSKNSPNENDPFKEAKLNKLQLMMYLLPVVGWIPALWTLYRRDSSKEQRAVSRLSVNLTLLWVISYGLLWFGSLQMSDVMTFRLLYLNGLLTSGYILLSLGLMIRVFQGKSPELPIIVDWFKSRR